MIILFFYDFVNASQGLSDINRIKKERKQGERIVFVHQPGEQKKRKECRNDRAGP